MPLQALAVGGAEIPCRPIVPSPRKAKLMVIQLLCTPRIIRMCVARYVDMYLGIG
jgi:hypothetical protein